MLAGCISWNHGSLRSSWWDSCWHTPHRPSQARACIFENAHVNGTTFLFNPRSHSLTLITLDASVIIQLLNCLLPTLVCTHACCRSARLRTGALADGGGCKQAKGWRVTLWRNRTLDGGCALGTSDWRTARPFAPVQQLSLRGSCAILDDGVCERSCVLHPLDSRSLCR